ncbi:MAG: hypothetical protein GF344_04695 [Chitinivibrionales bacterium]|nr:hypothetical protein [Chitinivibrionales bacterium]
MDGSEKIEEMALTAYQITILRLLSERRRREGISYVAGGAALNRALGAARCSRDLDLFHDTQEALQAAWEADRQTLANAGHRIELIRETPSFIEAEIAHDDDRVVIEWVRDSAFPFFPPQEDELLGLSLHPFDLATNKILAMAGRLEPRDWIDTMECHRHLQQLGYLIWAACGKDPGVNPDMVVSDAARLHYSQLELNDLDFEGSSPSASMLGKEWKQAVAEAKQHVTRLPEEYLGQCVLNARDLTLYRGSPQQLEEDLKHKRVAFHAGSIGGAWPRLKK